MKLLAPWLVFVAGIAHAGEAEIAGLVVNQTVTRSGNDFYRDFAERIDDSGSLEVNLVVRERPSARWGILIWVEMDGVIMYRNFLAPSASNMEEIAYSAADSVLQEINRRKVDALFEDYIDLDKDEL